MFDDLSLSFFRREIPEWHNSPQHLAYIGCQEGRQSFEFKLLSQFRVTLTIFRPVEFRGGDEPESAGGQGGMMLPGEVFLSLELIGADFIFAILNDPFDKIAATHQFGQELQRCVLWSIAESIGVGAITFDPDRQPFLMNRNLGLLFIPNPHQTRCKTVFQHAPFIGTYAQPLPIGICQLSDLFDAVRTHPIQYLRLPCFSTLLARLVFWNTHHSLFKIHAQIVRDVHPVQQLLFAQFMAELAAAAIQRITQNRFKGQASRFGDRIIFNPSSGLVSKLARSAGTPTFFLNSA